MNTFANHFFFDHKINRGGIQYIENCHHSWNETEKVYQTQLQNHINQTNMEIRNLEHTDFDTLFHGFEKAFADYEIHFEKEEVRSMLKRRGYKSLFKF